jgi:acetyl-CoA carboxylase carboxyl transferase subunit alpha
MPNPEGYRKALRLMKQAEKFKRPIICFIDTPGAYPGMGAEERGQAEAIARNLMEMANLKTPIICIVIGEGGSGGALALSVGDEIWMLEHSVYSVLSPEGFASILWKDGSRVKEAAAIMKITAQDIKGFGINR